MKFGFGDMEGKLKLSPIFNGFLAYCLIGKMMEFLWISGESGIQRTKTYTTRKMRCRLQLCEHPGNINLLLMDQLTFVSG
jgi:hypothetical protein